MTAPLTFSALRLSDYLTQVIDTLCRAAAAKAARRWVLAPLILLLWPYLRRVAARFDALVRRLGAARRTTPRPPRAPVASVAPAGRPARARLPQGFGWLLWLGPEAAALASRVRHLLADPDMAALLDAEPGAGRILRPLCRMLGIGPGSDVPPALFQRPQAAATPSSGAPASTSSNPASRVPEPLWKGPATPAAAGHLGLKADSERFSGRN